MACEIIHNTRWLHATKDTPVAQTGVSLSNLILLFVPEHHAGVGWRNIGRKDMRTCQYAIQSSDAGSRQTVILGWAQYGILLTDNTALNMWCSKIGIVPCYNVDESFGVVHVYPFTMLNWLYISYQIRMTNTSNICHIPGMTLHEFLITIFVTFYPWQDGKSMIAFWLWRISHIRIANADCEFCHNWLWIKSQSNTCSIVKDFTSLLVINFTMPRLWLCACA